MDRRTFCATAAALGIAGRARSAPAVTDGFDWSLPDTVQPIPYSGFVTWNGKRHHESITVDGIHIRWAELNPAPGQYRWDLLTDRIAKSKAAGMRIGLHLMGAERPGVPDWVAEQFRPPVLDVPVLQENQPWRIQVVPPWHPDVQREFETFLKAFGETGLAQTEDVVYGYIHAISASRGEELFLRPIDAEMYEQQAGLSPEVFGAWLRRRTDAMLAAFAGAEYKLAWMSGGPVGPNQAYRDATADLWQYALDHGTGIRGGGIDFQHGLFRAPAWGSSLTDDGYCVVDDTMPTIAEGRFRGDENEEYGKYWEWRFGPADKYDYRHRICSLRALQMRQNFQMVSPETLKLNPELNTYLLRTQGRRRETSPDAWAYLRECYLRGGKDGIAVKNIERWLLQRDVPGSVSVAAERYDRFALSNDPPDKHYDFDARRTDRANGQDGLSFQLDQVFWPQPAPAQVKVTVVEREACTWRLVTVDAAGREVRSEPVTGRANGERRTVTFEVESLAAARSLPGGMDVRLVCDGPGDLTVQMVRVIKPGFRDA